VDNESKSDDDDRPPICPACGVTMGIILAEDGATRYACLECGFSDETTPFVSEDRPRD
jgi:ribosomal protein S27AE